MRRDLVWIIGMALLRTGGYWLLLGVASLGARQRWNMIPDTLAGVLPWLYLEQYGRGWFNNWYETPLLGIDPHLFARPGWGGIAFSLGIFLNTCLVVGLWRAVLRLLRNKERSVHGNQTVLEDRGNSQGRQSR